jgi:hypothetical protein
LPANENKLHELAIFLPSIAAWHKKKLQMQLFKWGITYYFVYIYAKNIFQAQRSNMPFTVALPSITSCLPIANT